MTWVKLDDGFWSDPAIDRVGNEAAGVYARMLSYCGQHLTDGHVPATAAKFISPRGRPLDALIEAGLIEPNGDGYLIPKFLDYNPSKAQVEDRRRRDAERQRRRRSS